ncbi:ATP-binding protein [Vibrio cholerae]|uniref:tetratricopeptide repeat protein n=1 Tax=Vibrio cholerae TaxID=666 RepID=UPI0029A0D88A|nr:ATP-binding protein [Vibrio cholerae]HDL9451872.1 ATP-binding protein [Vibrio cholerae]
MKLEKFKTRTRMVVYALEQSLGNYIKGKDSIENLSEQLILQIQEREERVGRTFDINCVEDIVAASHFSEVMDLAVQSASNTSDEEILNRLRKSANDINLTTIRNSLSHANRDFKLNYWYLAASLATSAEVEILELTSLKEALLSAENDDLTDPPREWLEETSNQIPNNLPLNFEHDSTGLVGRKKEAKDLTKEIFNRRVNTVAVVAPGGVGKTALVLDLLHKLSFNSQTSTYFNGLLFVSLKTEELTPDGIRDLTAVESIEELKIAILDSFNEVWGSSFSSFNSLIESDKEYRPLLFIDNLETLIRDNEDIFNDFNSSLPFDWKVVITSRINVAANKVLPLPTLSESAAIQLAREYQRSKGSNVLSEENISQITKNCKFNPLAIKLTLDYWTLGNTLPDSWNKANSGIAEFSFKNLIETLSDTSIEVLELLFTAERCSRRDLCNLLGINVDDSAKAISELSKTSLINRSTEDDNEYYEINSSIREFLLVNPKNISVRQKVQNNIRTNKDRAIEIIRLQNTKKISKFSELYIPDHLDETLKISIHKANKLLSQRVKDGQNINFDKLTEVYSEFRELKSVYDGDYLYQRTLARLLKSMHDNVNAKLALLKAHELKPEDVATSILLARQHHEDRQYIESEKIYLNLLPRDEVRAEDGKTWSAILSGLYICLLYQDKYDQVFEITKKWKDDEEYGGTIGAYRAAAFRRKMETQIEKGETIELYQSFNSALKIMHTVLKSHGYVYVASRETMRIIDTMSSYFFHYRNAFSDDQNLASEQFLAFCDEHIKEIYAKQMIQNIELHKFIVSARRLPTKNNPFKNSKWDIRKSPSETVGILFDEIPNNHQLIQVKVINIPTDRKLRKAFIISEDAYEKRYFVHKNSFKNGQDSDFYNLDVGDRLAINPNKVPGKELEQSIETYYVK